MGIEFLGVDWGTPLQLISAIGTMGIFGALVTVITGYWKRGVDLRGHQVVDDKDIRDHYAKEVERYANETSALRQELNVARDELADCEAECARKMKQIEEELWGEKRQRVSEQISLINMILKQVDAPELATLRDMLERTASHMVRVQVLEQRVEDHEQD